MGGSDVEFDEIFDILVILSRYLVAGRPSRGLPS